MNRYGTPDIYRTLYHHAAMMRGRAVVGEKQPPEHRLRGPGKAFHAKGLRASRIYLDNIETPYAIPSPQNGAGNLHNLCHEGLEKGPALCYDEYATTTPHHEKAGPFL